MTARNPLDLARPSETIVLSAAEIRRVLDLGVTLELGRDGCRPEMLPGIHLSVLSDVTAQQQAENHPGQHPAPVQRAAEALHVQDGQRVFQPERLDGLQVAGQGGRAEERTAILQAAFDERRRRFGLVTAG